MGEMPISVDPLLGADFWRETWDGHFRILGVVLIVGHVVIDNGCYATTGTLVSVVVAGRIDRTVRVNITTKVVGNTTRITNVSTIF